ncbi:putative SWI/SNF-related matrix-associated actin-dependent regulator of chromatin subfamily A member 3-like 1 [Lotus japonicus]|uniref:putative SWI/SNF-related matrix-associated actin-dependent regulator of chromatin subfamily A member 3-like 1 n=1 Tax=Lotus japonicus TaxID=34305 RepID=UPI00258EEBB5|nr:putative SWI/SNF-related matrix-associated actin-dependent regulator of chromatin subfamily A member 3-like 1 [Lotus japonicus]XP_057438790.1 putative SWI/SNF-related matrix-associated actin-dependent regulator of chromatin subfamily A member 3-like 1 [Lotus japonicus]XP_057438791.1 putative SWI/SNF-related matrix-associated actin-dependent regulator of chromatin subfamily A member 3-like 1 [Lotus japonicus]XP_057438792.1 putative SWI/SNF-related matrix-associated actin-dependent regulator of
MEKLALMPEKKGESSKRRESGGSRENNLGLGIDNIIQTKLLKHQEEALEWLLKRESSVESPAFWTRSEPLRGGILNDSATLGKKLSLLSLIAHEKNKSVETKTTLVVSGYASLKNWLSEVSQHVITGTLKVLNAEFGVCMDIDFHEKVNEYDLLLIHMGGLVRAMESIPTLEKVWWRTIVDRAHTIEDMDFYASQAVIALKADRKWAVTGKPILNGSYNLLSVLSYLGFESSTICGQSLTDLAASISLGRTKEILRLPSQNVEVRYVNFSSEERVLHDKLKHEADSLSGVPNNEDELQNLMFRLIRMCRDSALCFSDSDSDIEDISKKPELQKALEDPDDCAICFTPPEDTLVTKCGHVFCRRCILKHLKTNKKCCPACRKRIKKHCLFSAGDYPRPELGSSSKVSELKNLLMESRDESPATKSVVFSECLEVLRFLKSI